MGLDMYLVGKRYLSGFDKDDQKISGDISKMFPELKNIPNRFGSASPVKQVEVEVGYWRKANAVHDWFVKNVQDGEDDCGYYHVSREQLEHLRDTCQQVLAERERAHELLPTTQGFFFGGTDYDEWYFNGLESTIEIVDCALALPDMWDIEYHSSW
jgi:hypothetical protein